MRRDSIIKGVADVEAVLKSLDEADRAIIFARIISGFKRPRAVDALTLLGQRADRQAKTLRTAAFHDEQRLIDPSLDPRPEIVLTLAVTS